MFGLLRRFYRSHPPPPPRIELDPSLGTDDYDWSLYHLEYRAQLESIGEDVLLKLSPGDYDFEAGNLTRKKAARPLHANHQCLYETISALSPQSAIEIGCGGGDHLHNLSMLLPNLNLRGFDRSPAQLKFLAERSPHLTARASILDITLPPSTRLPSADVVYTQAVIMHMQAGNSHLVALANIFRMARRHVVLMENFKRHRFTDDIQLLYEEAMIDWPEPRFYFRRYAGRLPHILVVSKDDLPFEPLQDYGQLLESLELPAAQDGQSAR